MSASLVGSEMCIRDSTTALEPAQSGLERLPARPRAASPLPPSTPLDSPGAHRPPDHRRPPGSPQW
eukprot:15471336-Alexandrium_andersonii.AAC.1